MESMHAKLRVKELYEAQQQVATFAVEQAMSLLLSLKLEGKDAVAVLTAGADLQPGEQAFIDYGEAGWRSSWEMLTTYGFVPGASVPEWLASGGRPLYFEGVSPTDPLLPQKQALLVALGADVGAVVDTYT